MANEVTSDDLLVGGEAFKEMLKGINVNEHLENAKQIALSTKSAATRDKAVKKMKYLAGLKKMDLTADKAYVLHNIPVLPPVYRPMMIQPGNRAEYADIDHLYRDLMIHAEAAKIPLAYASSETQVTNRKALYDGVKAVFGYGDAISGSSRGKELKGLATQIAGDGSPKYGFFQNKVLYKKQDFSGRGVIAADPTLQFNEVSMPKDQLWTVYKFHIIRDLVKKGYGYIDAETAYNNRTKGAEDSFRKLVQEVPVILNRPPTLMKSNLTAMYPVPKEGSKTIGMNILHLPLFAGDFDGDALMVHTPMTAEAIHEAKTKMLPQHQMFDYRKGPGESMVAPGHEAIIGSVHMTEPDMTQKPVHFKTEEDALKALHDGTIKENTPITIGNQK